MSESAGRVVAWQWRYICLEEWQPCTEEFAQAIKSDVRCETRALIPLTDHESALAELREQCVNWQGAAGQYKAELLASELRISTLLSGLEALAGECESRAENAKDDLNTQAEIAFDYAANQIRALVASAGLEGKDGR